MEQYEIFYWVTCYFYLCTLDDDRLLDYLQTSPAILVADEDVSENLQNSRLTLLSTNSAEDSDNVHVIQNSET